jgi:hypothetical protein
MVLDFLVQLSYLYLWWVYPSFLMFQNDRVIAGNNYPKDTPPNSLNTTFDYISMK